MPATTIERENARRRYVRALLATYAGADEHARTYGARWYADANDAAAELAVTYGFTVAQAAGVIAALSPRISWPQNLADARTVLAQCERERDDSDAPYVPTFALAWTCQAFTANVGTACRCAGADDPLDILNGPKQRAFYANIMGDADQVTVDVWATRAATRGNLDSPRNRAQYDDIAAAYRRAARAVGSTPRDFQAAVWLALRGAASSSPAGSLGGGGWQSARVRAGL